MVFLAGALLWDKELRRAPEQSAFPWQAGLVRWVPAKRRCCAWRGEVVLVIGPLARSKGAGKKEEMSNRVCCGSRGFDAIGQPWQTRLKVMRSADNGNSAVTGEGTARKWQRFSTRRGVLRAEAPAGALRRPGLPRPPRYSRQAVLRTLGARIRQLRVRKGWSQEALAQRSGLHRGSIGEIERGENNLRLSTLGALKPHLKITISELFKGIG